MLRICYTSYCQIFAIIKRNGGIIVDDFLSVLPAIIFLTAVVILIKRGQKIQPRNDAQRKLVDEVIATIERSAPDLDVAYVHWSNKRGNLNGVYFRSLSGYNYAYDYASHGYFVSRGMALLLASEIAKRFGGKYYKRRGLNSAFTHYEVIGPHQLAIKQQKKPRRDSLRHLQHL